MKKQYKNSAEAQDLWSKYFEDKTTYNKNNLINYYYSFLENIAKKVYVRIQYKMGLDELMSYGVTGLYDAIESYDLSKNVKFELFAKQRVWGSIIDGLRKQDWVPRSVRQNNKKLKETQYQQEIKLGQQIDENSIIEYLEKGNDDIPFEILIGKYKPKSIVSFENATDNSGDSVTNDCNRFLTDYKNYTADKTIEKKEIIKEYFGDLNNVEKSIIAMYYFGNYKMKEIAEIVNLSESRVSQLHKDLLKRAKERYLIND